ncbi:MAG: hypothetical protein QXW43_06130 [Candidatus Methanomethyliaceae archaeon]
MSNVSSVYEILWNSTNAAFGDFLTFHQKLCLKRRIGLSVERDCTR